MYTAKVLEKIDNGKGYWNYLKIGVFDKQGNQITEYTRNYSSFYDTFFPFHLNKQWYALYSDNYTRTAIMELPSGRQIAAEPAHGYGFCPVEYFIPQRDLMFIEAQTGEALKQYPEQNWGWISRDRCYVDYDCGDSEEYVNNPYELSYGFVAGCYWGADSAMEVQRLDLSKFLLGQIDRYGFKEDITLPPKLKLKDAVRLGEYTYFDDDLDKGPRAITFDCPKYLKITEEMYRLKNKEVFKNNERD